MWFVFALIAAVMAAISVILTKSGLEKVNPFLAFAVEAVLILVISWSAAFFAKATDDIGKMDKRAWLFLMGAGVATTLASIFQFKALKDGHAAAVSSIDRSSIIFTVLLAAYFLKEKLSWQSAVGAVLIVAGAAFISLGRSQAK